MTQSKERSRETIHATNSAPPTSDYSDQPSAHTFTWPTTKSTGGLFALPKRRGDRNSRLRVAVAEVASAKRVR